MELNRKNKVIKYVAFCLIIIFADLLQNVTGLLPQIGNARCLIVLPVTIMLAMGEDVLGASLLGLLAGLLWDLTSSVHLGFNCIFITVVCFAAATLVTYIARDIFVTGIIASAVTALMYCLLYWLFFIIIKGVDGGSGTLWSFYLPSAIYTVAISPIVWILLKPLKKKFNSN